MELNPQLTRGNSGGSDSIQPENLLGFSGKGVYAKKRILTVSPTTLICVFLLINLVVLSIWRD